MKTYFKIGKVNFSKNKCVIIAEAGVNHNGSIKLAEKLIKEAKKNGADIIKFQTYKAEKLVSNDAPRFWNWKGEIKKSGSQYDSYKRLDGFNKREYEILFKLCKKYKIEFMSTAFDLESVDMLAGIGMKGFKVASCDLNNYLLLEKIAKTKLPILLSTGASNLDEIKKTLNFLKKQKCKNICIMHCTLCYPTKPVDANLSAISQLKKLFPSYLIGLSDHTLGINIASSSVLKGVNVIEKHFTTNKKLKKSADHWLSINPKELNELRKNTDELLEAMGKNGKRVLNCEKKSRTFSRRSIFAKNDIMQNTKIKKNNIIAKRPGTGISPDKYNSIIGKIAKVDILAGSMINLKMIKKIR